jgi:hypothetical protein
MKDNKIKKGMCARGSGKSSYELIKHIRTDAIKEFAERLRENADFLKEDDDYIGYAECVRVCHIDNLVNEMTEGNGND